MTRRYDEKMFDLNHLRADYALEVSSPGEKYRRKSATSASEKEESSQ